MAVRGDLDRAFDPRRRLLMKTDSQLAEWNEARYDWLAKDPRVSE